jgi:hypothetical protein
MLGDALWADRSALSRGLWLGLSMALAEVGYRWVESPARWRWATGLAGAGGCCAGRWPAALWWRWPALHCATRPMPAGGSTAPGAAAAGPGAERPQRGLRQWLPPGRGGHGAGAELPASATPRPTVLLFGDSHAAQWVPALAAGGGRAWPCGGGVDEVQLPFGRRDGVEPRRARALPRLRRVARGSLRAAGGAAAGLCGALPTWTTPAGEFVDRDDRRAPVRRSRGGRLRGRPAAHAAAVARQPACRPCCCATTRSRARTC